MKRSGTKGLSVKKEMGFEDVQQFFKKMYIWAIVVSILAIIGLACLIVFGYSIRYPRVFFGSLGSKTYIVLLLVLVSPIIASTVGLFVVKSENYISHYRIKNVMNQILLLFCILLGIASGLLLIAIPPVESFTDSAKNYLKVDPHVQGYEDVYKEFFPEVIPDDATNINYFYRGYGGLYETSIMISASWTLPESSYEYYKQLIQDKFPMTLLHDNKFEINLDEDTYSRGLKLIFEYDDDKNELHYLANRHS